VSKGNIHVQDRRSPVPATPQTANASKSRHLLDDAVGARGRLSHDDAVGSRGGAAKHFGGLVFGWWEFGKSVGLISMVGMFVGLYDLNFGIAARRIYGFWGRAGWEA